MKKLLYVAVAVLLCIPAVMMGQARPDLAGTWQGTLQVGRSLRLVMKIDKGANGGYATTFYSIDQGGMALKASETTLDGTAVTITVAVIDGKYTGKLSADGSSMTGTWTQGGGSPLPLTLVRATASTAWEIPAPAPPPKAMAADAHPAFEVATIKPNDTGATGMQQLTFNGHQFVTKASSLVDLISFAYKVQAKQISGAPAWASQDRFDIEAVPDTPGMPSVAKIDEMLRKLLADRFQLKFHKEEREMSAFVLTQGKPPLKLAETQIKGPGPGFGMHPSPGGLAVTARNATVGEFAEFLQNIVMDRPVVDQTGLTGHYDFNVTFTPDDTQFNGHPPKIPAATENTPTAPGFSQALEEQTGLKVEAKKAPVQTLVIDHVERYSAN